MAIAKDIRRAQAMTAAEADALFAQLAHLTASIKREGDTAEKRKAEIDIKTAETVAPLKAEYDQVYSDLTDYIMAHPERFISPRKRKVGQMGTYGMEVAPDKVDQIDIENLACYSDTYGLDLYETERKPNKTAIAQIFRDGGTVQGAHYIPAGDVPKIKVAPGYIEQQLKG